MASEQGHTVIVSPYMTLFTNVDAMSDDRCTLESWQELAGRINIIIIICPTAIAYSMGQIIKSVCVCVSVCPSASTLTVAFLDRFSPKLAQT